MAFIKMAACGLVVLSTVSFSTAFAPAQTPLLRSVHGKASALAVQSRPRAASHSSSLKMGLFDGLFAVPGDMTVLEQYNGWIEKTGMKAFSFDARPQATAIPASGEYSVAGRDAGSAPPPQAESGGLFGFLSPSQPVNAPPPKENQDGTMLVPDIYQGIGMYCVFDGHGEYGGQVTEWTKANLPAYMAEALQQGRPGQLLNRITDAYRKCDGALVEALGYQTAEDSGSTLATVLLKDDLLLVAGLGDSRVVLGAYNADGTLSAQPLTLDQSPVVPAEKQRIEQSGGEVRREGPGGRVYAKGQQFPGLAVSRAFGDADAKQYGVTVDPQFIGWKVRKGQDFAVIAASDGVWNALSNEAVVEIVSKFIETRDSAGAAAQVVSSSREVWESIAKGRIDDISAVVIFL